MIETFEGRIGGGKTYTAVQRIVDYLAHGGVVGTNINLQIEPWVDPSYGKQCGLREVLRRRGWNYQEGQLIFLRDDEFEQFQQENGKSLKLSGIQLFWKRVPMGTPKKPTLVVIDEAHFHFPQSGYRSLPQEVVNFLTLSRHACIDIIFISQHIKNMWCQMTRLAQYRWNFRDMRKFGVPMTIGLVSFTIPWFFPHILQLQFDFDGSTLIRRTWDWRDVSIHGCYKSPELIRNFETVEGGVDFDGKMEGMSMKQKIAFTVGGAVFGAVLAVGCVRLASSEPELITEVTTNTVMVAAAPVAAPVLPVDGAEIEEPVEPVERVAAFVEGAEYSRLYISIGDDLVCYEEGQYCGDSLILLVTPNTVSFESPDGRTRTVTF